MGVEVFRGKYLSASGAHLAVQLGRRVRHGGRDLPGVLLVLLPASGDRLLLQRPAVSVGAQELLLLAGVRQEDQQLVEDAVKVFSEQVLTAAVVLDR